MQTIETLLPNQQTGEAVEVSVERSAKISLHTIDIAGRYTLSFYVKPSLNCSLEMRGGASTVLNQVAKDEWKKVVFTSEFETSSVVDLVIPAGTFLFWHVQLETGNQATDWRRAPEDVVADIQNVSAETTNKFADFRVDTEGMIAKATEQLVTSTELGTQISEIQGQISATASAVVLEFETNTVNPLSQRVNGVESNLKSTFEFAEDALTIKRSNSAFQIKISNEKISFLHEADEVAFIDSQKLYITDAEIKNILVIGKYGFIPRGNGNLSFKIVN